MTSAAPLEESERRADEDEEGLAGGKAEEAQEDGEPPELMDLIDAAEEAAKSASALAAVLRDIGKRIRLTPADRELLTDFEGTTQICKALSGPPHGWAGEAMLAFCQAMPDICRTSVLNRGALRDEGFLEGALDFLDAATKAGDETTAAAACAALNALCTANDGNKKAAARLWVGEEPPPEAEVKSGALQLVLAALARFAEDAPVQAEGTAALRALISDDDSRKGAEEEAFAILNRNLLMGEAFAEVHEAICRVFAAADKASGPQQAKLLEQGLLLLREAAREQDNIPALAFGSKLQKRAIKALGDASDAKVVRAALAALRALAFNEEAREDLTLLSDGVLTCVAAVQKNVAVAAVCEQGFGLFTNLTLRKNSQIAERLSDLVELGKMAIHTHAERPDVTRSVASALRNIASQVEAVGNEARESGLFEQLRSVVLQREGQPRWGSAVDISRQFLREFKADEGVQKKAVYNAYY